MRAGFSGENSPRCVFPTTVGRFRRSGLSDGYPEVYFGNETVIRSGVSKLTWPVRGGLIQDWEEMEKLWHHTFYSALKVPPEDATVLHAVDPSVPIGDREKMAEILFESLAVRGLNLVKALVLDLHASGRTSEVVYANGSSSCYVAPVFVGFPLSHSIIRSSITGDALSVRFMTLLEETGYSFNTPTERDLIDRIKKPAVIIDNGSRYVKAGFACDNHPVSIFRSVVGRPNHLRGRYGRTGHYDVFIGDDAIACMEDYELNSPVVNGRIVHWDNMERIWHHIFYKALKAAPEDRAIVLACSPSTLIDEKYKCCETFFEVLNAPALCIQPQSLLALFGSGLGTGIAVDIGYDTTNICPIYEGASISYARMSTGIAGAQLSDYITDSFKSRLLDIGTNPEEIIDDIMRHHLHVTQDVAMKRRNFEINYMLPDGRTIEVSDEVFMAGELLHQPKLVLGDSMPAQWLSIQDAVVTASWKCDAELRSELYGAVVMAGGLSMVPGESERIQTEVETILKKPVNVMPAIESDVLSWLGAAIFANLTAARDIFVTKKQFEEYGVNIIRNKFV